MNEKGKRMARICLRCTPDELFYLSALAERYGLTMADFIRQSTIIAASKYPNRILWRRVLTKSMESSFVYNVWTMS